MTDFMCYTSLTYEVLGDCPNRIGLLAKQEVSDFKVFFSVNIFIIKQSTLLTFLRLLRIVSSND